MECRRGGLPHHNVAHEQRPTCERCPKGCEIEWRDGVDKSFKRSIFEAIPLRQERSGKTSNQTVRITTYHATGINSRLLLEHIHGALDIEAQEIACLSSYINFGLPYVFALANHGGSHESMSVLAGNKTSCAQEDARTVFEGRPFPRRLRLHCTFNCNLHIGASARNVPGHGLFVIRRIDLAD
jgi:hypothetical protein